MSGVANVRRYLNEGVKVRQEELWTFVVILKYVRQTCSVPPVLSAAKGLEDETLPHVQSEARFGAGRGKGGSNIFDSGKAGGGT